MTLQALDPRGVAWNAPGVVGGCAWGRHVGAVDVFYWCDTVFYVIAQMRLVPVGVGCRQAPTRPSAVRFRTGVSSMLYRYVDVFASSFRRLFDGYIKIGILMLPRYDMFHDMFVNCFTMCPSPPESPGLYDMFYDMFVYSDLDGNRGTKMKHCAPRDPQASHDMFHDMFVHWSGLRREPRHYKNVPRACQPATICFTICLFISPDCQSFV
jgi:hypothetical protein